MSNNTRERILGNLRSALRQGGSAPPSIENLVPLTWNQEERVERLKKLMETIHAEVHVVDAHSWVDRVKMVLKERRANGLLYGPESSIGATLQEAWEDDLPPLTSYGDSIETFKDRLFDIDASITSTRGGIAELGALILWPDSREPRLMSLVPAVHIAVLAADKIYNTFAEAMEKEQWQNGMPTNALLISGPSKTADIELTLTFGVHGPKELIVLIVKD